MSQSEVIGFEFRSGELHFYYASDWLNCIEQEYYTPTSMCSWELRDSVMKTVETRSVHTNMPPGVRAAHIERSCAGCTCRYSANMSIADSFTPTFSFVQSRTVSMIQFLIE